LKTEEKTLLEGLTLSKKECISITGGGGKTGLGNYLARKLNNLGKGVIFTTTTKIYPPQTGEKEILIFTTEHLWLNRIDTSLRENKLIYLASEVLPQGKIKGLTTRICKDILIKTNCDYLIIEADGSKGRSIKAHSDTEPVVPDFTTLFIPVIGIDCLMARLDDNNCHRCGLLCKMLQVHKGELIDTNLIYSLFKHPEGYLKTVPEKSRVIVFINKVHKEEQRQEAIKLGEKLLSLKQIDGILIGHVKPPGETFILLRR
jgi:probable selenium-dependent hydroxylase accessory protein YqeC